MLLQIIDALNRAGCPALRPTLYLLRACLLFSDQVLGADSALMLDKPEPPTSDGDGQRHANSDAETVLGQQRREKTPLSSLPPVVDGGAENTGGDHHQKGVKPGLGRQLPNRDEDEDKKYRRYP
jgi:hypothetical protein